MRLGLLLPQRCFVDHGIKFLGREDPVFAHDDLSIQINKKYLKRFFRIIEMLVKIYGCRSLFAVQPNPVIFGPHQEYQDLSLFQTFNFLVISFPILWKDRLIHSPNTTQFFFHTFLAFNGAFKFADEIIMGWWKIRLYKMICIHIHNFDQNVIASLL